MQILNVDEASLVLVEHFEYALEILDLFLRVHRKDVNFLIFWSFSILLVWVNSLIIKRCDVDICGFFFTFNGFGLLVLLRVIVLFTRGGIIIFLTV